MITSHELRSKYIEFFKTKDHAEITLGELRENGALRKYFEAQYVR